MLADVVDDARFGRCCQADQRGRFAVSRIFPDEAGDVAVVRPEIVTPLGDAMRFVDDPVAHFPLLQDRPHRGVSELLRRNQQHRGVAEADTVERVVTPRAGQEPVDGDTEGDALPHQARDCPP